MKDFVLELENNSVKARTGIYLSNSINYKRKSELEGIDSNLLIVDIYTKKGPKRLINIYRSFNPQNNVNTREKFKYQLQLIKGAMTSDTLLIGDFNLNYEKVHDDNYAYKNMFVDFEEAILGQNGVT